MMEFPEYLFIRESFNESINKNFKTNDLELVLIFIF